MIWTHLSVSTSQTTTSETHGKVVADGCCYPPLPLSPEGRGPQVPHPRLAQPPSTWCSSTPTYYHLHCNLMAPLPFTSTILSIFEPLPTMHLPSCTFSHAPQEEYTNDKIWSSRIPEVIPCSIAIIYLHLCLKIFLFLVLYIAMEIVDVRFDANEVVVTLLSSNITVFALDFLGSGLSDGDRVSLGWHEKDDLKMVVSYLRSNKQVSHIGLWRRSMGANTKYIHVGLFQMVQEE